MTKFSFFILSLAISLSNLVHAQLKTNKLLAKDFLQIPGVVGTHNMVGTITYISPRNSQKYRNECQQVVIESNKEQNSFRIFLKANNNSSVISAIYQRFPAFNIYNELPPHIDASRRWYTIKEHESFLLVHSSSTYNPPYNGQTKIELDASGVKKIQYSYSYRTASDHYGPHIYQIDCYRP